MSQSSGMLRGSSKLPGMRNPYLRIFLPAAALFLHHGTLSAIQIPERDPRISEIVAEVSADRIASTVRRLAGFGTRHSLSDTLDEKRGIGAGRRWIKSEFDRIARTSGGRMSVEYQSFSVPASSRIPHPLTLVNV